MTSNSSLASKMPRSPSRHAQQGHLDLRVERARLAGGPRLGGDAAGGRPAGYLPSQRVRQLAVFQRARPQRLDRAAGLGQAVAGELLGVADPALALNLVAALLGRLELGDDPGQALRQRVVDLPGHPLPLVTRARLPGLGDQLSLQPGVLRDHLLQPVAGLGQFGDHLLAGQVLLLGLLAQHGEGPDEHAVPHRVQRRAERSEVPDLAQRGRHFLGREVDPGEEHVGEEQQHAEAGRGPSGRGYRRHQHAERE